MADLQQFGAAAQAGFAGGFERRAAGRGRQARHGRAAGRGRGARGDGIGQQVDVVEREIGNGIQRGAERDLQRAGRQFGGGQRAGIKGHVGADPAIARIVGMAMALPIQRADVDFDVAREAPQFGADPQRRVQEVGTGTDVPVAGMLDLHAFAGRGEEQGGAQALIGPDALQMALGESGRRSGRRFAHAAGEGPFLEIGSSGAREPTGSDAGWSIHACLHNPTPAGCKRRKQSAMICQPPRFLEHPNQAPDVSGSCRASAWLPGIFLPSFSP